MLWMEERGERNKKKANKKKAISKMTERKFRIFTFWGIDQLIHAHATMNSRGRTSLLYLLSHQRTESVFVFFYRFAHCSSRTWKASKHRNDSIECVERGFDTLTHQSRLKNRRSQIRRYRWEVPHPFSLFLLGERVWCSNNIRMHGKIV